MLRSASSMRVTRKNICFVTGTRAEFGLMRSVLQSIQKKSNLKLQIVATGMHLDPAHGRSVDQIRRDGWTVDRVVDWESDGSPWLTAKATGVAMASLSAAYQELHSDVVLVVGDRVEAFAAAAAAHVSGVAVAHIHGGDRAAGQIDDSLRHAITKLAHIHFPATRSSEERVLKLGEDAWRVHRSGSPGIDGITVASAPKAATRKIVNCPFALILLHPVDTNPATEKRRARTVLQAVQNSGIPRAVIVYPNNDPGAAGIIEAWRAVDTDRHVVFKDLARPTFLGLMRDACLLVGNSSSGIIEAASFGTPVIDVGPRQAGREHGGNVAHVSYAESDIRTALSRVWNSGNPKRFPSDNIYGGGHAGKTIAGILAKVRVNELLLRKLISY